MRTRTRTRTRTRGLFLRSRSERTYADDASITRYYNSTLRTRVDRSSAMLMHRDGRNRPPDNAIEGSLDRVEA